MRRYCLFGFTRQSVLTAEHFRLKVANIGLHKKGRPESLPSLFDHCGHLRTGHSPQADHLPHHFLHIARHEAAVLSWLDSR